MTGIKGTIVVLWHAGGKLVKNRRYLHINDTITKKPQIGALWKNTKNGLDYQEICVRCKMSVLIICHLQRQLYTMFCQMFLLSFFLASIAFICMCLNCLPKPISYSYYYQPSDNKAKPANKGNQLPIRVVFFSVTIVRTGTLIVSAAQSPWTKRLSW